MFNDSKRHRWSAGERLADDDSVLTTHGGKSADMDAAIQRNLENHDMSMSVAPACDKADMNVTYTDSWFWDIVMYLRSMDICFYKAPSGGLIASMTLEKFGPASISKCGRRGPRFDGCNVPANWRAIGRPYERSSELTRFRSLTVQHESAGGVDVLVAVSRNMSQH
jgi:hypothetical protein